MIWSGVYECSECEAENEAAIGSRHQCEICGCIEPPIIKAYRCPECEALNDPPSEDSVDGVVLCQMCGFEGVGVVADEEIPTQDAPTIPEDDVELRVLVAELQSQVGFLTRDLEDKDHECSDLNEQLKAAKRREEVGLGELQSLRAQLDASQQECATLKERILAAEATTKAESKARKVAELDNHAASAGSSSAMASELDLAAVRKQLQEMEEKHAAEKTDWEEAHSWVERDLKTFQEKITVLEADIAWFENEQK
eukprot:3206061-Rhodomonas_salina.6